MVPLKPYLLILSILIGSNAFACSCANPSLADRFDDSAFVFVGTVASQDPPDALVGQRRSYSVRVNRTFKGSLPETVKVSSKPDPMCGGSGLMLKQRYVFFQNSLTDMKVSLCQRAPPALNAEALMEALLFRSRKFESFGWGVFELLDNSKAFLKNQHSRSFSLDTLKRPPLSAGDLEAVARISPTLVLFWDAECRDCESLFTWLKDLQGLAPSRRIVVLSVYSPSAGESVTKEQAQYEFDRLGIPWAGFIDQSGLWADIFEVTARPALYFVPPDKPKKYLISEEIYRSGSLASEVDRLILNEASGN